MTEPKYPGVGDRVRALWEQGKNAQEIADELGISTGSAYMYRPSPREAVRALFAQGFNKSEISRRLHVSQESVRKWVGPDTQHQLNRDSWCAWLKTLLVTERHNYGGGETFYFNGHVLSDRDKRQWRHWNDDYQKVWLSRADRFASRIDAPLPDYFLWCRSEGRPAWVEQPKWDTPIDDVPEVVVKVLCRHLRLRTPFDEAWKEAVKIAQPNESWRTKVAGDRWRHEVRPIYFLEKVCREEYESALERRTERMAA